MRSPDFPRLSHAGGSAPSDLGRCRTPIPRAWNIVATWTTHIPGRRRRLRLRLRLAPGQPFQVPRLEPRTLKDLGRERCEAGPRRPHPPTGTTCRRSAALLNTSSNHRGGPQESSCFVKCRGGKGHSSYTFGVWSGRPHSRTRSSHPTGDISCMPFEWTTLSRCTPREYAYKSTVQYTTMASGGAGGTQDRHGINRALRNSKVGNFARRVTSTSTMAWSLHLGGRGWTACSPAGGSADQ